MVKRLRRSPLKAKSGVQFSVGLPKNSTLNWCAVFLLPHHKKRTRSGEALRSVSVAVSPWGHYTTVAQRRCFSVGILFSRSAAEVFLRGDFISP